MSCRRHTEEIVVRVGIPTDAATLSGIHARCFARGWDEAAMRQFLAVPGALVLVASRGPHATAQGFLIARAAADEAEILTLCALPDERRRGIARALLQSAAGLLRAGGTKHLFLEVDEGNEAALALYRSLGAHPVGRRARYYEHGGDATIFSLALSGPGPDDGSQEPTSHPGDPCPSQRHA